MAIEKDIAITCDDSQYSGAKGITQLIVYIKDDHHDGNKVRNVINYAENAEKTTYHQSKGESSEYLMNGFANKQVLVSSLSHGEVCRQLDEIDFLEDKEQYEQYKAGDRRGMGRVDKGEAKVRDAYHVIQSFPGKEHGVDLDPRLAHQIGVEYARRAFPGYKVIVATHLNTGHVHNHIAVCAYNEDHRHKLNFDSTFRRNIRRINDELCMAYNLPVLEEGRAYRHRQGVLHEEGLIKNRGGISMKDIIRNDIKRALSEAGDTFRWFPDFVRYMEDHMNYKIIQTTKNVTYIKKDLLMKNGKPFRCRDATLGEEYTRRYISEQLHWPILRTVRQIGKLGLEGHEYISEKDSRIRKGLANGRNEEGYDKVFGDPQDINRSWHIHIDRYDENGRRRSDLELIILTAIEFVKRVRTCFVIVMEKLGLSRGRTESMMFGIDPDRDEERLTKALGKIRRYGIDNEEQLNDYRDSIDAQLHSLRGENPPVTAGQKRLLYKLLNDDNQEYTLKCKYDDLSFVKADQVIKFLTGQTDTKPDILADRAERRTEKRDRLYRKIFDRIEESKRSEKLSVPISKALVKELTPLVKKAGIDMDLSGLTQGQGYGLLQHFKSIPLTDDKTITKKQADSVTEILNDRGLKLNKPVEYLLRSEYSELKKYLDTGNGAIPECLREFKGMSYSTRMQIEDCLEMSGRSLVIPIEYISEPQAKILVSDLLYHIYKPEAMPDIKQNHTTEKDISSHDKAPVKASTSEISELRSELEDIRSIQRAVYLANNIHKTNPVLIIDMAEGLANGIPEQQKDEQRNEVSTDHAQYRSDGYDPEPEMKTYWDYDIGH